MPVRSITPFFLAAVLMLIVSCSKKDQTPDPEPPAPLLIIEEITADGRQWSGKLQGADVQTVFRIRFSTAVDVNTLQQGIEISHEAGQKAPLVFSTEEGGKTVVVQPKEPLNFLARYQLAVGGLLKSTAGRRFDGAAGYIFQTRFDQADKFPRISDEELLTRIQRQTFNYFRDFSHPLSGMARERNSSGEVVTTGGTGFGIMSLLVGIHRQFISREEGLPQIARITTFLKDKCERYHGAFAHWVNGTTGATVPFSSRDDGGDLVETSLLMQGLLAARQYFDRNTAEEVRLRNDINELWDAVDWAWYTQEKNTLYWHWSKQYGFQMNLKVSGWNEALITYVLAASSRTHAIEKSVYDEGWARSGAMKNGSTYLGIPLPLGPAMGGPLFFAHYSFLGLNPNGLTDAYAHYFDQNKAHARINQKYCTDNPKQFYGYGEACWGLTASDDNKSGYAVHSPTFDNGVIAPTAAISSLPYLPEESMKAIRFFYYTLGDKIFKDYGFMDAFNLSDLWFSHSFLAIDQGPQIIMIENYRSGFIWDLFMSCPEIKAGLTKLGFSSPFL